MSSPQVSVHDALSAQLEAGGAEQGGQLAEAGRDPVRGGGEQWSVHHQWSVHYQWSPPGGQLSGDQQGQQHSEGSRGSPVEHL